MNNPELNFDKQPCMIIAEAGVNHNGQVDLAKKLVDAAMEAGADVIKFQSFKAKNLVTDTAPKADYQKTSQEDNNQFEMLKKLELSYQDQLALKDYCDELGILFMSTPFDYESVDLLEKLEVKSYKISSGDLTNIPFLRYIAKRNKPMIISTGMADLDEVEAAVAAVLTTGNKNITLLHCTSNYPTKFEDVNLKAMLTLGEKFNLPVGYSDHTVGIEVPVAAVALGAVVIEKHFTLDRNMEGPDHKASLEPKELKQMIMSIRNVEKALGDGVKKCSDSEEGMKTVIRKSIVASLDIKKGETISYDNITFKRPGNGLSPSQVEQVLGKVAVCDIAADQFITLNNVK